MYLKLRPPLSDLVARTALLLYDTPSWVRVHRSKVVYWREDELRARERVENCPSIWSSSLAQQIAIMVSVTGRSSIFMSQLWKRCKSSSWLIKGTVTCIGSATDWWWRLFERAKLTDWSVSIFQDCAKDRVQRWRLALSPYFWLRFPLKFRLVICTTSRSWVHFCSIDVIRSDGLGYSNGYLALEILSLSLSIFASVVSSANRRWTA